MDPLHLIEQHCPPGAVSHRLVGIRAREVTQQPETVAADFGREQAMNRPCGTPPR